MHKSKLKGITLAVLLALAPIAAQAAGLGRLTVTSGLGEPLSAEIELVSTTPDELASLTAIIAPQEAYNVQGVERTAIHNAIKVDVSKRADGTPILKLTTSQAVSDPFLDMLIQVDWDTGRLLREYTVLLDPPGYNNQAQVYNGVQLPPGDAPSVPASTEPATQSPAGVNTAPQRIPATPVPPPVKAAPAPAPATPQTYITASGDTLSAIARQHQVQGVSLDQMLVGLYRANEEAFSGNNMNRLKVGQILRVPSANELQQLTPGDATREVRVQTADWNAYRNRLADLAAESVPSTEGGAQQSASGRISSPAMDQAAPPANGPRDVVRLSSSNATQAQLNAMQEELTAKERSLNEAAERTAMLEKQIADMQKLLAIKNQALANLQNGDESPANPGATLEAPANNSEQEPEAAAPAEQPAPHESAADTAPAEDTAQLAKPEPQPAAAPIAPPPVEEPSLLDELVGDDPLPLALAAGVIVLLLGGWLYMRNKRKRELDSFEKGILTAGGLKPNTVFGNTVGATVNTGDTSFLNDFSQNTGGMIDTHDVDPIAEAEVYMAYGRDAQAEEILKDAIVKEPQRHELHLKLLEIYASRNDTSAFETVAGEIYTTLGAADPIWSKVAALGRKLEPDNPLYSEADEVKAAFEAPDAASSAGNVSQPDQSRQQVSDGNVVGAALAGAAIAATSVLAAEEDKQDSVVDDALFAETEEGIASIGTESDDLPGLDFDLDTPVTVSGDAESNVDVADQHADNSLDFALDLPEPPAKSSLQLDIAELDAAIPDFDLPELPGNETEESIVAESDAVPEFSIPELDEIDSLPEPESVDFPLETPDVDLDLPEIELPETELSNPAERTPDSGVADSLEEDGLSSIDFDLPEISFAEDDAQAVAAPEVDDGLSTVPDDALDAPEPAAGVPADDSQNDKGPHFDFGDIDLGESDNATDTAASEAEEIVFPDFDLDAEDDALAPAAADIDFSNISLDVAGDDVETESLDAGGLGEESADVDTKLDLVTAYMDMGDNEGARELLEEILKEGGPRQREKAQSILDDLP
ncbi:peptidoglycan-binding protein [Methylobacillus arboreus]|uniref:FimV/HubP family polar landmark protein n=1 Tax=Methylobacillus arboreus TaxID=755170 RepID=UPI001E31B290|nr:FimV/HubP family polar landmark protein [Methylobacillus arboreus]MCB5189593.1 peptidoglycan-binding protein [Methylobacillus arboreus]